MAARTLIGVGTVLMVGSAAAETAKRGVKGGTDTQNVALAIVCMIVCGLAGVFGDSDGDRDGGGDGGGG